MQLLGSLGSLHSITLHVLYHAAIGCDLTEITVLFIRTGITSTSPEHGIIPTQVFASFVTVTVLVIPSSQVHFCSYM